MDAYNLFYDSSKKNELNDKIKESIHVAVLDLNDNNSIIKMGSAPPAFIQAVKTGFRE